jgi:hypothetical protein
MPGLDLQDAAEKMAGAASVVLRAQWPTIRSYADTEFRKLAQTLELILKEQATGQISNQEAAILLDMQKQATRGVLTAVQGLGAVAAEEAIDAALGAVKGVVNGALGWTLI